MGRVIGICVALALCVGVVGACGGDDDDDAATVTSDLSDTVAQDDLAPCAEVYANGVIFDTADELSAAFCDQGDGSAYLPASATKECGDGRTLYWNDEGWGYLGEPLQRHAPGAELVAPATERDACSG